MTTTSPRLCKCCHEEPQVPPPPLPGQKDAPGDHPALQQLCQSHPAPGAVSIPPCTPGCAALPCSGQQWPTGALPAWQHSERARSPRSSRTGLAASMVALGGLFPAGCCSASLGELNSELRQGPAAIYPLYSSPVISFPKNLNLIQGKAAASLPLGISMSHGVVGITDRQYLESGKTK